MSDDGQARFPGKLPGKGTRNGLPEFRPYRWRPADAARDAQVQALLAGIRAQLTEEEEDNLPEEPTPAGGWWDLPAEGCGTPAGCKRHRRHGEEPCRECVDAERTYHAYRARVRRAARETA